MCLYPREHPSRGWALSGGVLPQIEGTLNLLMLRPQQCEHRYFRDRWTDEATELSAVNSVCLARMLQQSYSSSERSSEVLVTVWAVIYG